MGKKNWSCVHCGTRRCDDGPYDPAMGYPDFCPTVTLSEEQKNEVLEQYWKEENQKIAIAAAEVEAEGYCKWTRVEEIIRFARKIGAKKIGIATCVGLIRESAIFANILEKRGFQVYGIGCKVGAMKKVSAGIPKECDKLGAVMCNPIMQAKLLEKEDTDLNVVVGLCVGHDTLFFRYSAAPVTTLIVKDRVLGHNSAAALYTSSSYYDKLFEE